MRRWVWIGAVLLVVLGGIAIGAGAYEAGQSDGLREGLRQSGRAVEVVRVVGEHRREFGFFPFGLILFPLLLFGIFALITGAFWRRRWAGPGPWQGGPHGHGPWGKDGEAAFEDWHRRMHEEGAAGHPGPGGGPPTA